MKPWDQWLTRYWVQNIPASKLNLIEQGLLHVFFDHRGLINQEYHVYGGFFGKRVPVSGLSTEHPMIHLPHEQNTKIKAYLKKQLHRTGAPALIEYDRNTTRVAYYCMGKLHNDGAPAQIVLNHQQPVSLSYYKHGQLHRESGPAVLLTNPNGQVQKVFYFQSGQLHRLDGPAFIDYQSTKSIEQRYYIEGKPKRVVPCEKVMQEIKEGLINNPQQLWSQLALPNVESINLNDSHNKIIGQINDKQYFNELKQAFERTNEALKRLKVEAKKINEQAPMQSQLNKITEKQKKRVAELTAGLIDNPNPIHIKDK